MAKKRKSLSERRNCVRPERTDLCYATAKDLIQSGTSQISVASLSLASFSRMSVCSWPTYILYPRKILSIMLPRRHPWSIARHIIPFFLQFVGLLGFRLWGWGMVDLEMGMGGAWRVPGCRRGVEPLGYGGARARGWGCGDGDW